MSREPSTEQKELTGRHVLLSIIAFFVVLFLVNGAFIFAAVGSFRGEDVKGSYRQGLNYNETLANRTKQAELEWQASVKVKDIGTAIGPPEYTTRQLIIRLTNAEGRLISDVSIQGRLRHPVDTALDIPLSFTSGQPATTEFNAPKGRWTLEAKAVRETDSFDFRKDLVLE